MANDFHLIAQGMTYILDTIPIKFLVDAMDAEAALEDIEEDSNGEVPELLNEEESAILVENIRAFKM